MSSFPATTLALNKGKYYVVVTVPKELRPFLNSQKQLKLSTRTSDLKIAEGRKHELSKRLYERLEAAKPDPLSPIASALSISLEVARSMYEDGSLEDAIQTAIYTPMTGSDLEEDLAIEALNGKGMEAYEQLKKISGTSGSSSDPVASTLKPISKKSYVDACEEYLRSVPYEKAKTAGDARLALNEFGAFMGDIELSDVQATDVFRFSESLGEKLSRETIAKKVGYVRRLFDYSLRKAWITSNVFSGLKLDPKLGTKRKSYVPFSAIELNEIFGREMPEHVRLLLSILATSGMRLDEAALLDWQDIKEEDDILFYDLTEREGTVKNKGSKRKVPVHKALKSNFAKRLSGPVFPEFRRGVDGKAQADASKQCMKIVRSVTTDEQKVVHSLRGNFKDLLRDNEVDKETNDFITGHGSGDVAGVYGSGPSLRKRDEVIQGLDASFLKCSKLS